MLYRGKGGECYNLESKPFAQGGEGEVFYIVGDSKKVAKLYKQGLNDALKERKLLVMVENPPVQSVMKQIAWPVDVLYDGNNLFVGFVMPKLAFNEDLNIIYEYGSAAKYPNIPWRNKIIIAKNLCVVLDAVHKAGHVVGDLNPRNISVDPQTGHIVFIDTDSYHIEDNGRVYRCNVGVPEYFPVEIQKKMKGGGGLSTAALPTFTKETDNFALAIHIFQVLMNGTHPFSCRRLPSQNSVVCPQPVDNILNGDCPFINPKSGTAIPVWAPPLSILPKEMQDLFKKAFVAGHTNPAQRPTPEEWYKALTNLERQLKRCSKVSYHEFYNGLSQCPWCKADQNFNNILNGTNSANKISMTQTTISGGVAPYVKAPPNISYAPATTISNNAINTTSGSYASAYTGAYAGTHTGGYSYSYTKKRAKKRIIIILAAVITAILAIAIGLIIGLSVNGSSGTTIINLTAPTSLGVSDGQITWDVVENASSYVVKIDDDEVTVSQNSYSLDESYDAGTYSIAVKAQGNSDNVIDSEYSDEIIVVKPSVASNLQISEGILSWENVTGYSSYKILVNGSVIDTVETNTYSLEENLSKFTAGQNEIGIVVAGDNSFVVDSNSSETVSITKLDSPLNVSVTNDILTWQSVTGAIGYIVTITSEEGDTVLTFDANTNSYYLLYSLGKGSYQITVQAIGDNNYVLSSDLSSNYTYNITETIIYISTKEDLFNIANDLTAKYILQNDIDISGEIWTPLGTISSRFEGALIGNGYSIIGLTLEVSDTKGTGFFGVIGESGIVSDVNFVDVQVSGEGGYAGAVAGISYGVIFDVTVSGTVAMSTSGDNIGGLVGRNYGSIYDCINYATVSGVANVGGIAGYSEFSNANMTFSNCVNNGVIEGQTRVGGIVGYLRVSRLIYISDLINRGNVTASENYAGGICGYVEGVLGQTGNFYACINEADIVSDDYAGGCFGYVGNYINITTEDSSGQSNECLNTGNVSTISGTNKGDIKGN